MFPSVLLVCARNSWPWRRVRRRVSRLKTEKLRGGYFNGWGLFDIRHLTLTLCYVFYRHFECSSITIIQFVIGARTLYVLFAMFSVKLFFRFMKSKSRQLFTPGYVLESYCISVILFFLYFLWSLSTSVTAISTPPHAGSLTCFEKILIFSDMQLLRLSHAATEGLGAADVKAIQALSLPPKRYTLS